jgi:hypothetical protein
MVIYTWWCWHISEGGRVWAVERGLGSFLPPAELARWDLALSMEVKCLFSTAPEAKKRRRKSGVILTEKQWPDAVVKASGQFKLQADARERVADQRVWSLAEPARPVTHPGEQHEG